MNRDSVIFCISSLLVAIVVMAAIYPYSTLDQYQLNALQVPKQMDEFDLSINLGDDLGETTVIDLMAYYLENPPDSNKTPVVVRKFGGC
jgi:hypothetical protein